MTTLATTTWQAGPSDKVAVIDTYMAKGREVVSSIQDFAKRNKEEIGAVVRGGKAAAEIFPIIQSTVNGMKFNKDNMAARIMLGNSAISAVLRRAGPAVKGTMLDSFSNMGETYAKMGNMVQRIASYDMKNLYDVGNLINDFSKATGLSEVFSMDDQDSTVGFLAGTIREATRYGIPNSFSTMMSAIENGPILSRVTKECLPDAIKVGDLRMIGDMARMCSDGQVLQMMPNVVDQIGQAYKGSVNGTDAQSSADFFTMNETFSSIDELWDKRLRNQGTSSEESIKDLTSLFNSSLETQRAFRIGSKGSSNVDDKMNLLAHEFGRADVVTDLRSQFSFSTATAKGETPQADPRLLNDPNRFTDQDLEDMKQRPWYKQIYGG